MSFDARTVIMHSCFAPGTQVWTLTGRQPIEKIKIGDCVLAQDVESGELAYKPVLAVTVRQPGPRMRVGLGGEKITATPSHPFWVLGQGWRMTKQLAVGERVHTPCGGVSIESIEKLQPDPTYNGMAFNLIVADFNSYFVGEQGILVHDNTPRAHGSTGSRTGSAESRSLTRIIHAGSGLGVPSYQTASPVILVLPRRPWPTATSWNRPSPPTVPSSPAARPITCCT